MGIGDASFGVVCFSGFELVEAFLVIPRFMAIPLSQRQPDRGYAVLCGSGARGACGLCSDCAWPARGAQGAQGLAQAPRASARLCAAEVRAIETLEGRVGSRGSLMCGLGVKVTGAK